MYFKKGLDYTAEVLKYPIMLVAILLVIVAIALIGVGGTLILAEEDVKQKTDDSFEKLLGSATKVFDLELWKFDINRPRKIR